MNKQIKLGVIIPTRGDRPQFLLNCHRLLLNQTVQPTIVSLVCDTPVGDEPDITKRYREGYDNLRGQGLDLIAFIEDDDYYAPNYFEYMINQWLSLGKPDLLGTNYTIYYHIKLKKYFTMQHEQRSSAMNTFIVPDKYFPWCPDNDPYTDMHLWTACRNYLKGVIVNPPVLSLGMKHGIGKTGGASHYNRLYRYTNEDNGFLKSIVDHDSFIFYESLAKLMPEIKEEQLLVLPENSER